MDPSYTAVVVTIIIIVGTFAPQVVIGAAIVAGVVIVASIPSDSPYAGVNFPPFPGHDPTKSPGDEWNREGNKGSEQGDKNGNY